MNDADIPGVGTPGGRPAVPGTVLLEVTSDVVRVRLAGEIDAVLKSDLDDVVRRAEAQRCAVEVDVSGVTFMDSTGLGFLARLTGAVPEGKHVSIVNPDPSLTYVLELTDLASVLDVVIR